MSDTDRLHANKLDAAVLAWTRELAPHGIFTTDTELRVTSWNRWMESHSSLGSRQMAGRSLLDAIPNLGERRLDQYFRDALKGEVKVLSTALHRYLIPLPPPVEDTGFSHMQQSARIAPLLLDGTICGTITIIEDVTEREWQNTMLRRERERDEVLSATLVHMVASRDPEALVRNVFEQIAEHLELDVCLHFASKADGAFRLQSTLGVKLEAGAICAEFKADDERSGGAGPLILNSVDQSDHPNAAFAKSIGLRAYVSFPLSAGDRTLGYLSFGSRKNGFFPRRSLQFLRVISQHVAVALDRIARESELRASEERFRVMAETVPGIIFTATPEGQGDFVNEQFYALTGLAPNTDIRDGWLRVLDPQDVERAQAAWQHNVKAGNPHHVEFRIRDNKGQYRWMVCRAQPVRDPSGQIVKWVGAATDVHELKQTQLALAAAEAQLKQHAGNLEKMVEERTAALRETIAHLESFSYTVAHDLRAPIRAMQGYAQVVLEDYDGQLDKRAKELIGNIARASRSLDSLTRDVLNYTKVSTLKVELAPVDLGEIVQDVLSLNPALQSPNASIAVVRPLHSVQGHRTLLIQCFSNLLDNAVKFVRLDAPPRVIIRSEAISPNVSGSKSGRPLVRIWVEDNGIGIDEGAQKKIFGIFERARGMNNYAGTGVGLAIVAKAIERMGGTYGVESEVGAGSRFWVQLPGVA